MNTTQFTGAYTALITPFRNGKVSWDELRALTDAQIESGIDGLVAVGTTGESPTLDMGEHIDAIRCVVETAAGRVPVLAGTGANSTTEGLELTAGAHKAGADGMLIVAPYYNKPSPEGMIGYFSALAEATDRPVMLYSIPGRCGVEIGVRVIERLRNRYEHVNHIKESGGSCDRVDRIRNALGDSVTILGGDDALGLPFISLGAKGLVSVASNLAPDRVKALTESALNGDFSKALAIHSDLYPLFKALFIESSPVPVKFAMKEAGRIESAEVRSPLAEMEPANKEAVRKTLERMGIV